MSFTQIFDAIVVVSMWTGLFIAWLAVQKKDELKSLRKTNRKLHNIIEQGAMQRLAEQDEHIARVAELLERIGDLQHENATLRLEVARLQSFNKQLAKAEKKKGVKAEHTMESKQEG